MGAGADQIHPRGIGGGAQQVEGFGQVVDGLGDGVVHVGDEFDGVAEELLGEPRGLPGALLDRVEDDCGGVRQVARLLVHQRDLPLDAESRAG